MYVCIVCVVCMGRPQIRLMAFLLEAISRNAHKISLTILLCLVVLYTFATVTYMAFRNQYGFNNASDCTTLITCFKLHVDWQSVDSYILFQNMDSLVHAATTNPSLDAGSKNQDKSDRQEAAVLHLTILSTLASLSTGDYGHKMTLVLEEWQEHISKRAGGMDHGNMLVASVEILGRDGQVQQVS